jgi:hypothetical protein
LTIFLKAPLSGEDASSPSPEIEAHRLLRAVRAAGINIQASKDGQSLLLSTTVPSKTVEDLLTAEMDSEIVRLKPILLQVLRQV